jgi:WD40 repeat protein
MGFANRPTAKTSACVRRIAKAGEAQSVKMNWLNRLQLRANWPLWLAGSSFIVIFFSLIYSQTAYKLPGYSENSIIYPFLAVSAEIITFTPIILLVCLVMVGVWCLLGRRGCMIFSVLLLLSCSTSYFTLFLDVINYRVFHMQSLSANEAVYQLGKVLRGPDWDIPEVGFIVYECDSVGISCKSIYFSSYRYYTDDSDLDEKIAKISLIADASSNTIYLQDDKNILYLKDTGSGSTSPPVTFPTLANLTTQNADRMTEITKFDRGSATTLAWSPDGKLLAVGGRFPFLSFSDQTGVWIYHLDKQDKPYLLKFNNADSRDSLKDFIFTPNSQWLVDAGYDGKIRLLDVKSGNEIAIMPEMNYSAVAIRFREDGHLLVLGNWPRQVLLWDIETLSVQSILSDIQNEPIGFHNAAFSPDGSLLAFGEKEITIWDLQNRSIQRAISLPFAGENQPEYELAFTSYGTKLD